MSLAHRVTPTLVTPLHCTSLVYSERAIRPASGLKTGLRFTCDTRKSPVIGFFYISLKS